MFNVNQIARLAHEANREWCVSIGDTSQPSWEDAPDWQKRSAINGVGLHTKNPDTTPEQSHESWLAEKKLTGWQYGPVKNADLKQHPCYLPYADLPPDQRVKDHIFTGIVRLLSEANLISAGVDLPVEN